MNTSARIARHVRQAFFGGNWIGVNLKRELEELNWEKANTRVGDLNSIAGLVFHLGYYVEGVTRVLEGGPLGIRDRYSFDMPPISSDPEWKFLVERTLADAERFARTIENLPEDKLSETFVDKKYGDYYHNLHGIIEHVFYHLGQIVLIKKLLRGDTSRK